MNEKLNEVINLIITIIVVVVVLFSILAMGFIATFLFVTGIMGFFGL
jgi:nitrate reductase NapE component